MSNNQTTCWLIASRSASRARNSALRLSPPHDGFALSPDVRSLMSLLGISRLLRVVRRRAMALIHAGCSRNQKQPSDEDQPSASSRDQNAVWGEALRGDGRRDDHHQAQIHNADDDEDQHQAEAARRAAEAETQTVSPGNGRLSGKKAIGRGHLAAAGQATGLPCSELEGSYDQNENANTDRN